MQRHSTARQGAISRRWSAGPLRLVALAARARLTGQRGTTLAEVAASFMVLSILVASSAPIFSVILGGYHLRGAAQEIFAELQKARMAAVMENTRYRFSVVDGSPVYKIYDDKNHNSVEDDGEVSTYTLESSNPGVTLEGTDAVTFLPNGTALTSGTITVASADGHTKDVAVSAGGRIRVH
jgi:Tfp pilus assembly protein FimT